jgi:hypothetical protein
MFNGIVKGNASKGQVQPGMPEMEIARAKAGIREQDRHEGATDQDQATGALTFKKLLKQFGHGGDWHTLYLIMTDKHIKLILPEQAAINLANTASTYSQI